MGGLGYKSNAQEDFWINENNIKDYVQSLKQALITPYSGYKKFKLPQQLNPNYLQIENEFYSMIRPKRVASDGETPLKALDEKGIEYLELRCLDVNPFLPLGIDKTQIQFLDNFILFCLFNDSPETCPKEAKRNRYNID